MDRGEEAHGFGRSRQQPSRGESYNDGVRGDQRPGRRLCLAATLYDHGIVLSRTQPATPFGIPLLGRRERGGEGGGLARIDWLCTNHHGAGVAEALERGMAKASTKVR